MQGRSEYVLSPPWLLTRLSCGASPAWANRAARGWQTPLEITLFYAWAVQIGAANAASRYLPQQLRVSAEVGCFFLFCWLNLPATSHTI